MLTSLLVASIVAAPISASLEEGRPLFRAFAARDYESSPQLYRVAVGPDGSVVFGAAGHLIEYDGTRFTRTQTPISHIRSLALSEDGSEVFVAGVDHIGVVERDATGRRVYRALESLVPVEHRPLGQVWEACRCGDDVWFATDGKALRLREDAFQVFPFEESPGPVTVLCAEDATWIQRVGVGLFRVDGDAVVAVSSDAGAKASLVEALFSEPDGSLLLVTRSQGLVQVQDGRAHVVDEALAAFAAEARIVSAIRRDDGSFVLGLAGKGVAIVGPDGSPRVAFGPEGGLPNGVVPALALDRDGSVWLATFAGLVQLELPGEVTRYGPDQGFPRGIVNDIERHDGRLFVSSTEGLFVLQPASADGAAPARFELHPHSPRYPQEVVSHPLGLIVAGQDGLWRVRDDGAERVWSSGEHLIALAWWSRPSGVLLAGRADGLSVLAAEGRSWREVARFDGLGEIRSIVEDGEGTLMIGTTARGLHRITPGHGERAWSEARVETYDEANGRFANPSGWTMAYASPLGVLITGEGGVFRHDPATDRVVRETRLRWGGEPAVHVGPVAVATGGEVWANVSVDDQRSDVPLGRIVADDPRAWSIEPAPAPILDELGFIGATRTLHEASGAGEMLWVAGFDLLLRVRLDAARTAAPLTAPQIRSVELAGVARPVRGDQREQRLDDRVPHSRLPLRVAFASPALARGAGVEYRTRLVGWHDAWSDFSPASEAAWTGLPGGRFRFEVQARDRLGRLSAVTSYSFRAAPAAWLAWWAWIGYATLAALVFAGTLRWRLARADAERRRLEALVEVRTSELEAARQSAETANRAKSRFLANMSHELRTPLNAILGFTQILDREPGLGTSGRGGLEVIRGAGDRLLHLIDDVLDLARIEAGRVELRPVAFRLGDLVRDVEQSFAPRCAARGLRWSAATSGDTATVIGDVHRIRQVLDNLVSNAVKFTREGEIELTARRGDDGRVRFEVRDTGIGMAEHEIDRVFHPFEQAVTGRPPEPGTGLGLAIARQLAEAMGGSLSVASRLGSGSTFTFDLPLPAADARAAIEPPPGRVVGYAGPRRRILVVDDVATNRQVIREILGPLGFEVTEAEDGPSALDRHARTPADLAIVDLRMPGMDGAELARRFRALPESPVLIATSASVFSFDRASAAAIGCNDFLPKPFAESLLLALLRQHLGLEWRVEDEATPAGVASPAPAVPPAPVLSAWLAVARTGNVIELRRLVAEHRAVSAEHGPFCTMIASLAASYRMGAVRERLEAALGGAEPRT